MAHKLWMAKICGTKSKLVWSSSTLSIFKKKTFYEHCMRVHALLKNVHTFVVVLEEMQQTAQIISSLGVN